MPSTSPGVGKFELARAKAFSSLVSISSTIELNSEPAPTRLSPLWRNFFLRSPRRMMANNNTSNRRFTAYRGLIALNNLGVKHLENGRYPQAFGVLKDALVLHHSYHIQGLARDDLSIMIVRMMSTVVREKSVDHPSRRIFFQSLTFSPGHVVNIPNDTMERLQTLTALPIRVEVEDFDLDPSEDSLELQTAIILHNLATASLCSCLDTAVCCAEDANDTFLATVGSQFVEDRSQASSSSAEWWWATSNTPRASGRSGILTAPTTFCVAKARRVGALFQACLNLVELICLNRINTGLLSSDGAYGYVADVATLEAVVLTSMIPLMFLTNVASMPSDEHEFAPRLHASTARLAAGLRECLASGNEMLARDHDAREKCAGAA